MKQETTVRIMQVIAAVVAVPRGFTAGDAGGKDAFIKLSEVPDPALLSKYF